MKSTRSLLPLILLLIGTNIFAQNASAQARAKAREDSARVRRAQLDREREMRRERRAEEALERDTHILEEHAHDLAEAALAGAEALDAEALEDHARLAAELAGEAVAGIDWDGLTGGLEHLGEAFEHMELSGLKSLEGLEGLRGLAALEGLSALADIPPFPAIAPISAIPPIGPLPPALAGGAWREEWHGASRQYRQYLSEAEQTRLTALRSLLNNDETLALPEVKNLMQESNWAMRASALEMLGTVERREAVSILREALQRETDNRVKRAAIRALSHHDSPEAREALRTLLQK